MSHILAHSPAGAQLTRRLRRSTLILALALISQPLMSSLDVGAEARAEQREEEEEVFVDDEEEVFIPDDEEEEFFVDDEEEVFVEEDEFSEDEDEEEEEEPQDTSAADEVLPEVSVEAQAEYDEEDEEPLYREAGTETIKKSDLETRQVRQLSDALEWMVSGSPTENMSGGSAIIVDGLPAAQLQVTQDGMPVSRPVGGPDGPAVDLDTIQLDESSVESVTVRRGLGTPGSGPAGGVVVELEPARQQAGWSAGIRSSATLIPEQLTLDEGAVDPGFPPRSTASADVGYATDTLSMRLNGGFNLRSGLDVNGDGVTDSADQRQFQLGARGEWNPSKKSREGLTLNINYQDMRTEGVYGPTTIMRDLIETERLAAQLSGKWQVAPGTRLTHATQFDDYQHRFSKHVLSSGFKRLKADTGQLRVTQDVLLERLVGDHLLGVEVYGAAERIQRTGETGDLPEVDRLDAGLGLSDTWMPTHDTQFSGRLWGSLNNEFDPDLMADLSAQWQPTDMLVLRGSASRSRRLPTAEELYLFFDHSEVGYQISGNPDLLPEELWSGRAGFDLLFDDRNIQLSLEGFYNRLNNLIINVIDAEAPGRVAQYLYANIDRAQTAGLNASAQARELFWGVGARANYSWLPLAEDINTGERLSLRTYHQVLVELSRKWLDSKLDTSAYLRARSALETAPTEAPAPGYTMLGLRASYMPVTGLRLGLNADNLLNQTNSSWGPKEGFSLLGHLTYRFNSAAEPDAPESFD